MRRYMTSAVLAVASVLAPLLVGTAPASAKSPFTIMNDPVPVETTVVNTMRQRTCTGIVKQGWGPPSMQSGFKVIANWYR